jgi:hypothetical protein
MPWNEVYQRLTYYAEMHRCDPPLPPKPLILAGWAYSNDTEKKNRWEETVRWSANNGCAEFVNAVPESEFYFVEELTFYTIGPAGGPMYRPWDFEKKERPVSEVLQKGLGKLQQEWQEIVGDRLSRITRPLAFSGRKARRLIVETDSEARPPWGGWDHLSNMESERRTFTQFRAKINDAISPLEVDHIDFVTGEVTEQNAGVDTGKPSS